jgi:threonyl-tRNA synthetase
MITITLPDGSQRHFNSGITPLEVAKDISEGLARNVISAEFNDKTVEVSTPLTTDGQLTLYTWRDHQGKKAFWHSSAHVLAQALEELYPGVKLWVGPAIENGFYYDVDLGDDVISEKDF